VALFLNVKIKLNPKSALGNADSLKIL